MKLDKKNMQLLNLLYQDSRMSLTTMGKKLKLSPSAVDHRLKSLKENGIITLLFADLNLARLGLKSYRIYLKFDVFDKKTEDELFVLFKEYQHTVWGTVCEGAYEVIWRIAAKDEFEVERALAHAIEKFGTRIIEKTVVTSTYQAYLSWSKAFDMKRQVPSPPERVRELQTVDTIDQDILSTLYANSRTTTVTLATKTGLTPDAIQYRIKRLKKSKHILGNTAWFDARKLGFNYYKLMIGFRGVTKNGEREFRDFCMEHDTVIFVNKVIGSWDIEVDIIVRDNNELHGFMQEIKSKFGQLLGKHAYVTVVREIMLNPLRESKEIGRKEK